MLRDAEEETTEFYEMIYKLIYAPTFRNSWHLVNYRSTFRYSPVFSIAV